MLLKNLSLLLAARLPADLSGYEEGSSRMSSVVLARTRLAIPAGINGLRSVMPRRDPACSDGQPMHQYRMPPLGRGRGRSGPLSRGQSPCVPRPTECTLTQVDYCEVPSGISSP